MRTCKVCGAEAAGYNFTVLSCGSCRAFFRRQVVESKSHICFHNGNCLITVNTRTKCMACRFSKCLAVGMDPTLLQPKTACNLKLKSIGFYEQHQKQNSFSAKSAEHSLHYSHYFEPADLELLRLAFEAMKIVDPRSQSCTSSSRQIEFSSENQPSTSVAKLIHSLPEAFGYTESYAPSIIKYCKSFPTFRSLPSDDQLTLLKYMHTSMISIVLSARYDLAHDGLFFDVAASGSEIKDRRTVFLPISTYLEYTEMDCATGFRSYAYAMKVQTDGDPMLRNLIAARQIFSVAAGSLKSAEEIRVQQATFDRLLFQYLLFKYGNEQEAKERYSFLLKLMEDLAGVHMVIGRMLACFIEEGKPVGQLNKEIYNLL